MTKLIMCRACRHQISEEARVCPQCGAPSKRTGNTTKIVLWVLGGFVFLSIVGAVADKDTSGGRSTASSGPTPAPAEAAQAASARPAKPARPLIDVTPEQLRSAYEANEISADELYRGKMLRVSAVVDSIKKDLFDKPFVVLRTSNQFMGVHASFKNTAGLSALASGREVTMRCIGNNVVMGSPMLKDCVLE